MFLEYWMIGIVAVWWVVSTMHVATSASKKAFDEGVGAGMETTLSSLVDKEIISIDNKGRITARREE